MITTDGIKIECRIDRDETKAKQPLVFILGGRGSNAFSSISQIALTQLFIKHGFATLRINSSANPADATIQSGLANIIGGGNTLPVKIGLMV